MGEYSRHATGRDARPFAGRCAAWPLSRRGGHRSRKRAHARCHVRGPLPRSRCRGVQLAGSRADRSGLRQAQLLGRERMFASRPTAVDDATREQQARARLHPIQDLETLQLLDALVAWRDGRSALEHSAPPFNHPIDRARLLHSTKASSIASPPRRARSSSPFEPDAAPGILARLSIRSWPAHFYDGKYFHRVVPNFVAQGGCPRGDGYGSMDWTLRTDIGMDGFTTGAVGVASAGRDTESCQFFITLMPAPHLDGHYTRFAHVVSGMDVAQRLAVSDRMTRVERADDHAPDPFVARPHHGTAVVPRPGHVRSFVGGWNTLNDATSILLFCLCRSPWAAKPIAPRSSSVRSTGWRAHGSGLHVIMERAQGRARVAWWVC